ncbi:SOS response-associated peptidase [bacterium]|nr:MAG: SOS response-associated peptidase [bacterium]
MCGRFSLIKAQQDLEHYYHHELAGEGYRGPNYNVAPTQYAPVVTSDGLEMMKWGLIPQWAKDEKIAYSMINAVGETVFEKPTYKKPIITQRCLVPATGFYEWLKLGTDKIPQYFTIKDRELFSFAGLFITRKDVEGRELKTFTILTTTPNELVAKVHDRMPVILSHDEEKEWIDPDRIEPERISPLIDPYPANEMNMYAVDRRVGNIKNNSPELILPVQQ